MRRDLVSSSVKPQQTFLINDLSGAHFVRVIGVCSVPHCLFDACFAIVIPGTRNPHKLFVAIAYQPAPLRTCASHVVVFLVINP